MGNWTLARLKGIVAFVGAMLTIATTLDWGVTLPAWVTALAALLTAAAVYVVPNLGPDDQRTQARRALAREYDTRNAQNGGGK